MGGKKLTKKWLKNHMTYSWWKYAVLAAVCILGVNLVFTMTAYRVPEEKKVEVFVLNGYTDSVAMHETLWPAFSALYPEQEELTIMNVNLSGNDTYGPMQFATYTAAQQGDVFLISMNELKKHAAEGAESMFMELTPFVESGIIDTTGLDLSAGMFEDSAGNTGLYAIPADGLYGLFELGNDPAGSLLCITSYSGNEECSAAVLNLMLDLYTTEKPAGYDEMRKAREGFTSVY